MTEEPGDDFENDYLTLPKFVIAPEGGAEEMEFTSPNRSRPRGKYAELEFGKWIR